MHNVGCVPWPQAGHVCGDTMDVIDGLPTGSIRVSFGYMSTMDDAKSFIDFITNTFVKPVSNGQMGRMMQKQSALQRFVVQQIYM